MPPLDRPVIVIGAGSHAKVVVDLLLAAAAEVLCAVDIRPARDKTVLGIPVLDEATVLAGTSPEQVDLAMGIGGGRLDPVQGLETRLEKARSLEQSGFRFPALVHPTAYLGVDCRIGAGAQVMAGAVIQPDSRVGEFAIINTRAAVDHDGDIGDGAHIGPGAVLAGTVSVGASSFIGAGSSIIQDIQVGDRVLVAAGSVVIDQVPTEARVAGVPAKNMTKGSKVP